MSNNLIKETICCGDMIPMNLKRPYKIAIIRETKLPMDTRAPLTPWQCAEILLRHGDKLHIVVERSPTRCFSDQEYANCGIELVDSADDADIMVGVKEVSLDSLVGQRAYIMFSHTIKKQAYNRELLRTVLSRQIRLLDWECMKNDQGLRVIAFGRWAGIVGAHNTVMTWGMRTGAFRLSRLHEVNDWAEARANYATELRDGRALAGLRVVLTGDGRVSSGCCEVLDAMGIRRVPPDEFLAAGCSDGDAACYTQLPADRLYRKGVEETWTPEFFADPGGYHSVVWPFLTKANALINGIFWDNRCPPLFTLEQMTKPEFSVKVIGDITCDIAPVASIPSTVRPSTIKQPIFGFNPRTGQEEKPHSSEVVDVMAVDNLPNELPRDASQSFGEMFMTNVLEEIIKPLGSSRLVNEATIADAGRLTDRFTYLQDYVD